LGRQADTRDAKVGAARAENRTLELRLGALEVAKADAARECKSGVGTKCATASARVDKLVGEMRELRTVSPDPRADAIADLFHLVASADKVRTRQIVSAVDPLVLPLFLEIGSILFFAVAFPRRASVASVRKSEESVSASVTVDRHSNQRELARVWGVHESTVSRRLRAMEVAGQVTRLRDGRCKLALPAPR
jgi:DNA-binding IclR family transcriptional regulator